MEFHIMGSRRPLSKFIFGVALLIFHSSPLPKPFDSSWSSPLPEPFDSSLDCGTFLVEGMVGLLDMNCNTILGISSSPCLSVFT